ncbi:MAG: hypothetical protein WCR20_20375, partial [Verrucomicrobiota bacterium]
TAFGPNPDGPGTVLRVWEQVGIGGGLDITLPAIFTSATPVSLRGEKQGSAFPVSGKITVQMHAYAPASFILETRP